MKKLPLIACCVLLLAASGAFAQTEDSMRYLMNGGAYHASGDYKRAIPLLQKAFDLEKKDRKLERNYWLMLVDFLGTAYEFTGDIKSSQSVIEYGISKEPTYPLFYYDLACGYGDLGDEDNAIKNLRMAFKYKANMLNNEELLDPETDVSFKKFAGSEKFKKAVAEMKK